MNTPIQQAVMVNVNGIAITAFSDFIHNSTSDKEEYARLQRQLSFLRTRIEDLTRWQTKYEDMVDDFVYNPAHYRDTNLYELQESADTYSLLLTRAIDEQNNAIHRSNELYNKPGFNA